MRPLKLIIAVAVLLALVPSLAFSAGGCGQSVQDFGSAVVVTFQCQGAADDGSIPNTPVEQTIFAKVRSLYFFNVTAYPTPGGTAPDAADVQVLMRGMDLLGGKGVNLIHQTATQDTAPYSAFMAAYRYPVITSGLTLAVANQATVNANYTIELIFVR